MCKSMTAYGRASKNLSFCKLVVEILSVNRKALDVSVYLPKDLLCFDVDVRKWISSKIERGQITARISLTMEEERRIRGFLPQLMHLQKEWNSIAETLNFDPKQSVTLSFLLGQLHEPSLQDSEGEEHKLKEALSTVVHAALDELLERKCFEGKLLARDLLERMRLIAEQIAGIEKKKQEPYEKYRQKITERLQEMERITPELEDKVMREVVFLAERMDVTEELVRLSAHKEQFHQLLQTKDKAIGRTLEFLTQEMLREINTLGAKLTSSVVLIKSELEKIREQIQNIE
jgi:uncharacterized protein (TIGR00255 family)